MNQKQIQLRALQRLNGTSTLAMFFKLRIRDAWQMLPRREYFKYTLQALFDRYVKNGKITGYKITLGSSQGRAWADISYTDPFGRQTLVRHFMSGCV